jgi:hypothetical protein
MHDESERQVIRYCNLHSRPVLRAEWTWMFICLQQFRHFASRTDFSFVVYERQNTEHHLIYTVKFFCRLVSACKTFCRWGGGGYRRFCLWDSLFPKGRRWDRLTETISGSAKWWCRSLSVYLPLPSPTLQERRQIFILEILLTAYQNTAHCNYLLQICGTTFFVVIIVVVFLFILI